MRIMWITGMGINESLFQGVETDINTSGGWIEATLTNLSKTPQITQMIVVSVQANNITCKKQKGKLAIYKIKGKPYNLKKSKRIYEELNQVIQSERPDLIDVQGIEFDFALFISKMSDIHIPVLYTLQGLLSEVQTVFKYKNVLGLLKKRSRRDNLTFHGTLEKMFLYMLRGKRTIQVLKCAEYVTGRTDWDRQIALKYNKNIKYYHVDRILRAPFYASKAWDIKKIRKYSLFAPQVATLMKGGHLLLDIVTRLRREFPELIVWVMGENLYEKDSDKITGYEKYILESIDKCGIRDAIKFTGKLKAKEIIEYLYRTHIFLQVSLLENCSNALAEAQMVGVPCIASDVGGTSTYIEEHQTGYLYNPNNLDEAINKIKYIFENDKVAEYLSKNERKKAQERHNISKNISDLIECYRTIICNRSI